MPGDSLSSAELLSLRPEHYLQQGYRDARGEARPELTGLWAVAAAHQLRAAKVTPAELDAGIRALAPVALAQAGSPMALPEKLALRMAIEGQPRAVRGLLEALIDGAQARADLRPMLAHLAQILSLLALGSAIPAPKR